MATTEPGPAAMPAEEATVAAAGNAPNNNAAAVAGRGGLSARCLLCSVVAFAVLYAVKVWVLYLLIDLMGLGHTAPRPPSLEVLGGTTPVSEDQFSSSSGSAARRAVVAAFKERQFDSLPELFAACDEAPCDTLRGEMSLAGLGVPRNISEALVHFSNAAARGDPDAQYALGALHANVFDEEPDKLHRAEAIAVLNFYGASIAGHPGALMAMGYRHAHGYGVPKSCNAAALNYIEVAQKVAEVYSAGIPQAVELVRLGVEGGDRKAMSQSEINLFLEIAASGDANVAAAVGKRYLLGIDGFRQSYAKAAKNLQMAAEKSHGAAMALLGYMHCLGLGVPKDLDVAYSYFVSSALQNDPLGHNGLGYIFFHGTPVQAQDLNLAFKHFNDSAHGGSADGIFNLASMYLTGTGTGQSFQSSLLWYTQALDRGHTPAAYTLAIMHLNGIGTVRDCQVAVELLKRVCERGDWVSRKLQEAYDEQEVRPESAAWLFLRLAEAGHEVAQMNLAYLLDSGSSSFFLPRTPEDDPEEARSVAKIHAQRFYELSASQGNALSELRLGDYAYYGWGISSPEDFNSSADGNEEEDDLEVALKAAQEPELHLSRQDADPEISVSHYKRTAALKITGEWMQPFVARASFNLGYMYQFGIGVPQDLQLARRHYHKCLEIDPSSVQAPVGLILVFHSLHLWFDACPSLQDLQDAFLMDARAHLGLVHIVAILVLVCIRNRFAKKPAALQEEREMAS